MQKKRAAIFLVLMLGCVAADIVAPTKSELAAIYRKATAEAAAHHYAAALEALDILDARQPDLAAVENLRGVIFLRQGQDSKATKAFNRALEIDPQFSAARFNLADISFQKKDWPEAGKQLEELLKDLPEPAREEMGPLIHYRILLTVLMAKKEEQIGPLLSQLKEGKQSPAFDYGEAAIAFRHGRTGAGKGWLAAAAKEFSAEANKPYLESFYELEWLPRPAGEPIATADFSVPEDRPAPQRSQAPVAFEEIQRALQQRDFERASKLLEAAEKSAAQEPAYAELRAEALLGEKRFGEAEAAINQMAAAAPGSWKPKFLQARLAFAQGDYAAAQSKCEEILRASANDLQPEEVALTRYQLFLSQLLLGKESTAQQTLDQFKFSDPTPAFYYAQAAWSFNHHKAQEGATWIDSAEKLFSAESTSAYANPLAELGWLGASADGKADAAPSATPPPEPVASPAPVETPSPSIAPKKSPTPTPDKTPKKAAAPSGKPAKPDREKEHEAASPPPKASTPKNRPSHEKTEARSAKPSPTATPAPTPTPRPPFLNRLAQTLRKAFKPANQKPNQKPAAGQQSPSPAPPTATPASRRRSN